MKDSKEPRKKYKPKARMMLFACYWWNPFFWLALLITPFFYAIKAFFEAWAEVYSEIKNYNLK